MYDIEVFLHIKAVRAVFTVNFVASVVHCKAYKDITVALVALDKLAELTECVVI